MYRFIILMLVAVVMTGWTLGSGSDVDPEKAVQELNQLRTSRLAEAREKKATLDLNALNLEIQGKAKAYCEGVDSHKVEPAKGLAWAQLFNMAEKPKDVIEAARRFLSTNPDPTKQYQAQMLMLQSGCELGDAAVIHQTIATITPANPLQAYTLAIQTIYSAADPISQTEGAEAALNLLNRVEGKIPYDQFTSKEDKSRADSLVSTFAAKRAEYLIVLGRKEEALKTLEEAESRISADNKVEARRLNSQKTQILITNEKAPALSIERGYGEFKGLEAYKGKVVILDFFAHWCGPCIRSFPAMKQMYADLHDKGLEIFGVTTYYGYYKKERELDHDTEFGKMKEFIAEHSLPWPILYGERSNFEAYGVSGIPHVVLIDKDGKVNYIKVGYSEQGLMHLREKVEALLSK